MENNNTQLVINGMAVPSTKAVITQAKIETNINALDSFIEQLAKSYEVIQYSDNLEEQKKQMKEDRAGLNKLSQAIDTERIRIKKEASKEIENFEASYKNLIEKISIPCKRIDENIKTLEKKQREEKLAEVNAIWEKEAVVIEDEDVRKYLYTKLFSDKFLNVTTTKKSIKDTFVTGIRNYIDGMDNLSALDSEFKEEGIKQFKQSLNLAEALALVNRFTQQQKEAEERMRAKLEAEKQEAIRKAEEKARREEREKAEAEKQAALAKEREKLRLEEASKIADVAQMSLDFTQPASNHPTVFERTEIPVEKVGRKPKVFIKIENGQVASVFSDIDVEVEILDVDTVMDEQELIDFAQKVESKNCKKVC